MGAFELLRRLHEICERLGVDYLTVGSMATIMFGKPRLTLDVDVVLDLKLDQVDDFCTAFPDSEFYLSKPAVLDAIRRRSQFNIVEGTTALKIDCMIPDGSPHSMSELRRGTTRPTPAGFTARFASPEDVIIKKMQYFQMGGSDKHLSDCALVLQVSGPQIDRQYISRWAAILDLGEIWKAIQTRVDTLPANEA